MNLIVKITLISAFVVASLPSEAQRFQTAPQEPSGFEFRNIGAFRINAWVGEFAVPLNPGEKHRYTWYVASRNGGVWKTINNGTTFECITDGLGVSSIGNLEIAGCRKNLGEYGFARFSSYSRNNHPSHQS
jgi:hypothetical protein